MSKHEQIANDTVDQETYRAYKGLNVRLGGLALAGNYTVSLIREYPTEEEYADEIWMTVSQIEVEQKHSRFQRRQTEAEPVIQLLPIMDGRVEETKPLEY